MALKHGVHMAPDHHCGDDLVILCFRESLAVRAMFYGAITSGLLIFRIDFKCVHFTCSFGSLMRLQSGLVDSLPILTYHGQHIRAASCRSGSESQWETPTFDPMWSQN